MYTEAQKEVCAASMGEAMQIMGSKWTFWIIGALAAGPQRFNQLRRSLGAISTKSLTEALRALEQHRIVRREVFATVPVTVEYSLSDKGRDFLHVYESMHGWGQRWR